MKEQAGKIEQNFSSPPPSSCPRAEIAAYLDCELAPREELMLEGHLTTCEICRTELNAQKKLLSALDFALEEEKAEIEIPKDFAKVVAVRAESNVSGLRDRDERSRAIFLSASLIFLVVAGLGGAETEKVLAASGAIFEQVVAIVTFAGHMTFDFALGVVIIVRSLSNMSAVNEILAFAIIAGILIVLWMALTRLFGRSRPPQQQQRT